MLLNQNPFVIINGAILNFYRQLRKYNVAFLEFTMTDECMNQEKKNAKLSILPTLKKNSLKHIAFERHSGYLE